MCVFVVEVQVRAGQEVGVDVAEVVHCFEESILVHLYPHGKHCDDLQDHQDGDHGGA